MFKITFGKMRYNADKLILDDKNNSIELGNGFIMRNLCESVSLQDFIDYANKQYNLGDNIINADIWYSRNGGFENTLNYVVERIEQDVAPTSEPTFERIIFVDERAVHNYGVNIADLDQDLILFLTPRFVYTIRLSHNKLESLTDLREAVAQQSLLTMATLTSIVRQLAKDESITLTSRSTNRNS